MYEAQADTINVDDIATNSNNRIVLKRIKRNADDDYNSLYIQDRHDDDGEDCVDYVPEGAEDMGWLGYFIGKNDHLKELYLQSFTLTSGLSVRDVMEPFLRGISHNKSIQQITFFRMDLLGGEIFTMFGPFFQRNHNLTVIDINNCTWGDEEGRLFALALGISTNKSLQKVGLNNNNIAEEGMVAIITALSMHPHLQRLELKGNHLRKNACVALATLLQNSAKELQCLFLSNNEINDEGIGALVPALTNCSRLQALNISNNPSITTRGWQSLTSVLESPNSNLTSLDVDQNNIDDEAVAAFANALASNNTLQILNLWSNSSITAIGWQSFSKLLCDPSSVNATFLSNHTLQYVGSVRNAIAESLLLLNQREDTKEVAMIKVLQHHEDFDMLPFFEWEFKVLPLVLGWFEQASEYEMPENFEPNIEPRKLSTIYQFVRGMPVLYVETRLRKELEDLKEEQRMLKQRNMEIEQRNLVIEKRKISIMEALGRQ